MSLLGWFRALDGASFKGAGVTRPLTICRRFLNISNPMRRTAAPDIVFDAYLPVDDKSFDEGVGTVQRTGPPSS